MGADGCVAPSPGRNAKREPHVDGGVAPLASILLRDGTTLQIAPDGVRAGDKVIELAKIQDARRVSPNPETIAFRVAGMGLLEYQPEREGDGATALEALYRLRPELRPAGFGVPAGAARGDAIAGGAALPSRVDAVSTQIRCVTGGDLSVVRQPPAHLAAARP